MTLSDLKRIVDLLVEEGCGECDCPDIEQNKDWYPVRWERVDNEEAIATLDTNGYFECGNEKPYYFTGNIQNPDDRAKLVAFLKENFK